MERRPFATLVSVAGGEMEITHLPLTPVREGEKVVLVGHMARANPHWRMLARGKLTAVFHGAHAYITPKWYEKNDVPTWNYSVVHATGSAVLIEDEAGVLGCLRDLTRHVEKFWPSGWEFYVPEDLERRLVQSIVGFRLHVDHFEFKQKLGQNKPAQSIKGVMLGLESRSATGDLELLADMKRFFGPMG